MADKENEFIGVTSVWDVITDVVRNNNSRSLLKREALMFHRIAIPYLSVYSSLLQQIDQERENFTAELNWLIDQGIVFEPIDILDIDLLEDEQFMELLKYEKGALEMASSLNDPRVAFEPVMSDSEKKQWEILAKIAASRFTVRRVSAQLRRTADVDAFPILPEGEKPGPLFNSNKSDVIKIVFKKLPVLDDTAAWEHIIEFRNDSEARRKFLKLRRWISKVAQQNLEPQEAELELQDLINDYETYMRINKIQFKHATMTVVVSIVATAVGGWKAGLTTGISTAYFSYQKAKMEFSREELKVPGQEIAYIVSANQAF